MSKQDFFPEHKGGSIYEKNQYDMQYINKMQDENIICSDDIEFVQVLPKDGVYNVSVVFNDQKQSELETTAEVVSGKIKLKLLQDDLCFADGLKTVNFTV